MKNCEILNCADTDQDPIFYDNFQNMNIIFQTVKTFIYF